MGTIHFIGGEKGGVGKSVVARLLAQYFIDSGLPFHGFDSDRSLETFSRFYGEFSSHLDAGDFDSMDQIIAFAEEHPDHHIVVDLAAQTFNGLKKWIQESEVFDLFAELGFELYFWHVMDDGADSMFLLDKLLKAFPDQAVNIVVVRNYGRGGRFEHFNESAVYQKALNRGVRFLDITELQPALIQKIDFNNLSFWAAANNRQAMGIAERKRVGAWLKKHYGLVRDITQPAEVEAAQETRSEREEFTS